MIVISVIVGSTRQNRFSEKPAQWILQHVKKRDVDARLPDLHDFSMPFFDQACRPLCPDASLTRMRSSGNGPLR